MEGSKTNPGKANNTSSVHVIVDADACPRGAMEVLRRLRREYGYKLVTVASFHHDIGGGGPAGGGDRKSTRLNSSHVRISYAVFCLKKKKKRERGRWMGE